MLNQLLSQLKRDCAIHGHGRKKWWATQLGIPPLTLSHWLAGRQVPNGQHALQIQEILQTLETDCSGQAWKDCLWKCYYLGEVIPNPILSTIILEVLTLSALDSRTLALLSHWVEAQSPNFELPRSTKLLNRLGWLLSVSGKKPFFTPDHSVETQTLLISPLRSPNLAKHFHRYQTSMGKTWRLWDCPLDEIKKSLP